jgi:hypothetical protein
MDPQLLTSWLVGGEHCAIKTHGGVKLWTHNYWPHDQLEVSTAPWRRMGEWTYGPTVIDLRSSWRWALRHEDAWGSEPTDPLLLTSDLVESEHCAMKTHGGLNLRTHNYWPQILLEASIAPWRHMGSETIDPQLLTSDLVGGEHFALKAYGEWNYRPAIIDSLQVGGEHCVLKTHGGVNLRTHNYWPQILLEVSTAPWRRMGEWTYGPTIIDLRSSWRWALRHEVIWGVKL